MRTLAAVAFTSFSLAAGPSSGRSPSAALPPLIIQTPQPSTQRVLPKMRNVEVPVETTTEEVDSPRRPPGVVREFKFNGRTVYLMLIE